MGSQPSSPTESKTTINGQPALFVYTRPDTIHECKISWTPGYKAYPTSKWTDIAYQDIIVVDPGRRGGSSCTIFYVVPNEAAKDNSAVSPVLVKTLVATGLPKDFLLDFQPPGQACLLNRFDNAELTSNFHIILSTGSGTRQASAVWDSLVKPVFDGIGLREQRDYTLHVTSSELTVSEVTRDIFLPRANLGVQQSILLLSGDGGMVDIVNTLLAGNRSAAFKKPSIALMPLGTGNALSHSAGITADNTMGFRTFWRGSKKELPVFSATFSPGSRLLVNEAREERPLHIVEGNAVAYGAVVCSWGLHAGLVADSDTAEYRKFGSERFQMAAKEALYPSDGSPAHAYRGKISILQSSGHGTPETWQPIDRDAHGYLVSTYCSHLEKGFNISPASRPLDGKFRLVHFGPIPGEEAMDIMKLAYQEGKHVEDERVGYQEIQGLKIEFDEEDPRWRRICVDGQIIRVEKGGWAEVRGGVKGVVDLIS